jgi:uncharacterized protein (DUF2062 family)
MRITFPWLGLQLALALIICVVLAVSARPAQTTSHMIPVGFTLA